MKTKYQTLLQKSWSYYIESLPRHWITQKYHLIFQNEYIICKRPFLLLLLWFDLLLLLLPALTLLSPVLSALGAGSLDGPVIMLVLSISGSNSYRLWFRPVEFERSWFLASFLSNYLSRVIDLKSLTKDRLFKSYIKKVIILAIKIIS